MREKNCNDFFLCFFFFLHFIPVTNNNKWWHEKRKKKKDNFSISFFHSLCALLLICFSRFSFVALGCLSTSLIISLFVLPLFITRIVSLPLSLFSPLLQLPGFSPLFHFFIFFFLFGLIYFYSSAGGFSFLFSTRKLICIVPQECTEITVSFFLG